MTQIQKVNYDSFDLAVNKASQIYRMEENASKIFKISTAVQTISQYLTDEQMQPIMNLQGKSIGFKSDKDDKGGYPLPVVRDCIIDAMMVGVQPVGNQFNIIGGKMYITKEGFFYLLKHMPNLESYSHDPIAESFKQVGGVAEIKCIIKYKEIGKDEVTIERTYKVKNHAQYGSYDAVIGKMERKARKDIFEGLTSIELNDGEIDSLDPTKEIKQKDAATVENSLFTDN